jgi:GGDEF domain-containing protein
MVASGVERMLLIGDRDRQMAGMVAQALPAVRVTSVPGVFDALAELAGGSYGTVLVAAEPMRNRPEAAVRALREMCGDARLLLFAEPSLEPLSRRMVDEGADDYLLTPASPAELRQALGAPPVARPVVVTPDLPVVLAQPASTSASDPFSTIPLAQIVLDAMQSHPQNAVPAVVEMVRSRLPREVRLELVEGEPQTTPPPGMNLISHPLRHSGSTPRVLQLAVPQEWDEASMRHALAHLAQLLGKVAGLSQRHSLLMKQAYTDDLTGVYNARFFRYFLAQKIEQARAGRFPVTLLLFDIDNFKKYNDEYGHAVGDEILRQTAALMKRCCRDHDLVARIGGDEFAVVFWDKEGPRQVFESHSGSPNRVPQTATQIFQRFQRLISAPEFRVLGMSGQGTLTASGGLAVFPYDAQTPEELTAAADRELMLRAKRAGKNCVFLVGDNPGTDCVSPATPPSPQP